MVGIFLVDLYPMSPLNLFLAAELEVSEYYTRLLYVFKDRSVLSSSERTYLKQCLPKQGGWRQKHFEYYW